MDGGTTMTVIRLCVYVFFAHAVFISPAFGEARSIQSFVEAKEQWPKTVGADWRLEGRYALIGEKNLRFVNCSMPFHFGPDVKRPGGRFTNLEATGKIERRDGRLIFMMDSVRSVPTDMERLTVNKARIDNKNAQDWYDLASWAARRGQFYKDVKLREASQELQRTGLQVDFLRLKASDRDGLVSLIKKARDFKLDKVLIQEFLHDGYWDRFFYLRNREPATDIKEYSDLLVSISNDLHGARKPLDQYDANVANKYFEKPTETYKVASIEERATLERQFYLHVATIKIVDHVDGSGKNALLISKELKKEVPERTALIERYAKIGLKYESDRVSVMTRQEMLDLAGRYEKRDETEKVTEIKKNWLNARERLYSDNGARGLVDLAEEWIQLLNDRPKAAKFYIAAWKQNSQYPLVASWLRQNGYALHKGEWVPKELVPPSRESVMDKAIREGRIEKGMTTTQVKTAMGVAPDSIVRFATNGKVTELWLYESSQTMIQFSWKLGRESSIVESIQSVTIRNR